MPNDRALLTILAISTLIMAVAQVVILIVGFAVAKRFMTAISKIEQAAMPVISHVDAIATEGLTALESVRDQLGRVEHLTSDVMSRIDQTAQRVQSYVLAPARQGIALLAGARAVMHVFRRSRVSP
jgi:uncharacterized protein YoxC